MMLILLPLVVVVVLCIIPEWKIFVKAGQPGWACLIPIYNGLVMLQIIKKPWWWLLLLLIPLVNIYFAITMVNLLSKSFGKDVGFTIGLIFLPFIFIPILGYGSAKYIGGNTETPLPGEHFTTQQPNN